MALASAPADLSSAITADQSILDGQFKKSNFHLVFNDSPTHVSHWGFHAILKGLVDNIYMQTVYFYSNNTSTELV